MLMSSDGALDDLGGGYGHLARTGQKHGAEPERAEWWAEVNTSESPINPSPILLESGLYPVDDTVPAVRSSLDRDRQCSLH